MPHVAFRLLGSDVVGDASFLACGTEFRVEIAEEFRIASDMARIQQSRADRGVLGAFDEAVIDRARGVTDFHAEVPQEVEHVLDDLERLARRLVCGQEQQIDVTEWCQYATAITAGGGHRQMFRLTQPGV